MEYAKDIVLEIKDGQAVKSKKQNLFIKFRKGIANHKMLTTVITATISFIIIDLLLISSFVNVLMKI